MNIDWNDYRGANRQRWAELLRDLLGEAKKAIESSDDARRQVVWDALDTYIQRSPNTFSRRLDEMARRTLDDIFRSATEDLVQDLASRTGELSAYIKDVRAITEEANASSSFLSLEFARNAIDATTQAVGSLKALRDSLSEGNEDAGKLASDIEKAIKAIQKVRSTIEDAPPSTAAE